MTGAPAPASPVTLVTGASTGIGRALSDRLLASEHRLLRTSEVGENGVPGNRDTHVQANLEDPAAAERIVAAALDTYGRLDNLALVAGRTLEAPLAETDTDSFDRLIALNLRAPLLIIRAAHGALRASRGRVVVCSSVVAQRPPAGFAAYAASKAGLEGLVRALSVELGRDGIAVNAVAPGLTSTPRIASAPWFGRLDHTTRPAPSATPEEIADVFLSLLDPRLTRVSGAVLTVDAGLHLHPVAPRWRTVSAGRGLMRRLPRSGRDSPSR